MTYWVYENYADNKAVTHKAKCAFCNDGAGLHRVGQISTRQWHGPYPNVIEARARANDTGRADVRDCKVCAP